MDALYGVIIPAVERCLVVLPLDGKPMFHPGNTRTPFTPVSDVRRTGCLSGPESGSLGGQDAAVTDG